MFWERKKQVTIGINVTETGTTTQMIVITPGSVKFDGLQDGFGQKGKLRRQMNIRPQQPEGQGWTPLDVSYRNTVGLPGIADGSFQGFVKKPLTDAVKVEPDGTIEVLPGGQYIEIAGCLSMNDDEVPDKNGIMTYFTTTTIRR